MRHRGCGARASTDRDADGGRWSACAGVAGAQTPGLPVVPIPDLERSLVPQFEGATASPNPVDGGPAPPRNPFMAPNPRNNIHDDPYMTDTYSWSGPARGRRRALLARLVRPASAARSPSTRPGRIVTVCVGLDRPVLALLDPHTLADPGRHAPAAPQREPGRQPVHRLLRRRLLLPRPARPGGDPDDRPPRPRRLDHERRRGFPVEARLRPQRRGSPRRRDRLGAARLERAALVRHRGGHGRDDRPRQRRGAHDEARRARGSPTRSRSTRPAASTSSPTRRSTGSTPTRRAARR